MTISRTRATPAVARGICRETVLIHHRTMEIDVPAQQVVSSAVRRGTLPENATRAEVAVPAVAVLTAQIKVVMNAIIAEKSDTSHANVLRSAARKAEGLSVITAANMGTFRVSARKDPFDAATIASQSTI